MMKLSDIFNDAKVASESTDLPEQFAFSGPAYASKRCDCNYSPADIQDYYELVNMVPTIDGTKSLSSRLLDVNGPFKVNFSNAKCFDCKHRVADHVSGCSGEEPDYKQTLPRVRSILPTTNIPDDKDCTCFDHVLDAIKTAGLDRLRGSTGAGDDINTLLNTTSQMSGAHHQSELRRAGHAALTNVLHGIFTGGSLTPASATDPSGSAFRDRGAGAALVSRIQNDLPEGTSFLQHWDNHRKYGGLRPEDFGKSSFFGETYRLSQNASNQSAARALQQSQAITDVSPFHRDNCDMVCKPHADKLQRLYDTYSVQQKNIFGSGAIEMPDGSRSTEADGIKHADETWHALLAGHPEGKRLVKDSNDLLVRAQAELDNWRDSGHLYGESHNNNNLSTQLLSYPVNEIQSPVGTRLPDRMHQFYHKMVYGTGGKIFSRRDKNSALNTIWNSVRESSGYNDQSDMERNAERFFGVKNPQGNLDQINKEKFNAVMEHLNKHYPNLAKEFYSEEPIYAAGADGTSFKTDRSRFKINTGNYIIHGISGYKNDEGETTRLAQTWTEVPNRTVSINPYTGDEEPYVNDLFKYILKRAHGVDLDNPIKKKITDSNRDSLTCQSRAVDHGGGSVSYEARRPGLLPELEFPSSDRSRLSDKEKAMAHEHICTDHVHHDFDSDGNITAVYTKPEIRSDHIMPLRRLVREGIRKINPDLFDINPRAAYDYAASSYRRFLNGEIELNGEVTEKGKRKRPGSATSGVVFSPGKAKRTDGPSTKKQDRGGPKQNRPRKK